MFLHFNRARKKTLLLQPRPKASVDRIRFLVRQSLGFTQQHISCVHRCESDLRLIKQINKNKGRQVSCFSALIVEHLVVRRKRVHQVIPLLLLSYRWYHPYLGFMCLVHEPENTYFWYENELIFVSFHELYWFGNGSFSFLAMYAEEERNNSWQKPFQLSQLLVTSSLALCHLRIDGTSAFRERILPLLDTCPCSDQIRQVVA